MPELKLSDVPGRIILRFEQGYIPTEEHTHAHPHSLAYKLWRDAGGKTDAERAAEEPAAHLTDGRMEAEWLATRGEVPAPQPPKPADPVQQAHRRMLAGGGPAFPLAPGGGYDVRADRAGLSIRDWFAGQALVGLTQCVAMTSLGERAYQVADQMMKARERV
jgi:hypothetical protein